MIKNKHIPQWKIDEINHLVDLFKNYKNVVVIEVAHINDMQIQTMRKILRGNAVFRMSKKSLQLRAIEQFKTESKKKSLDKYLISRNLELILLILQQFCRMKKLLKKQLTK